jgi:hypothetical protein
MNKLRKIAVLGVCIAALLAIQGCATRIRASETHNPSPPTAFSEYGRIQLKPVTFRAGYRGHEAARISIDENVKRDLQAKLEQWNSRAENGRTLYIEPVVEEVSFKSATKRVFLGPLAGSSGVLMRVHFRDQDGKEIANPQFFQRTAAMSGGFTLGVMDNLMLTRVANLASAYVIANYEKAQGGPTGAE